MSSATSAPLPRGGHLDVVVLRWPEQRVQAARLAAVDHPHLLLVEPSAAPPDLTSCLVDWVRLPVDDADVRARLRALVHRAARHPALPALDEFGELSYRGRRVFLSRLHADIAAVLVDAFGRAVADATLFERVWPDRGSVTKMRVHMSRLRKRVHPLGLEITSVRGFGYRLHETDDVTPSS